MKEKGVLVCVCAEMISKEDCLTNCPKGMAIKPDIMVEWPNWKKDVTTFKVK